MKINLYSIPYAGGSSVVYNKWSENLQSSVNIKPVELSGRGKRFSEPLYEDIHEAVEDIFNSIKEEITEIPYALFGHSMGALIAFELAQRIRKAGLPSPVHIFISGRSAPHVNKTGEKMYSRMDDVKFRQEVLNLGGTPKEFFSHPELLELFLPVLKNDFRLVENYSYNYNYQPLNVDMTVLLGKGDDLTETEGESWSEYTTESCEITYLEGGHFFINEQRLNITQIINNSLKITQ
ncbi:MAG: thioesterase II family protein [Chryseobacterium sp.]